MQLRTSILKEKESLAIKVILVFLASAALIAEVLPEFEAKAIVIPTLVITLFICSVEILKHIPKHTN